MFNPNDPPGNSWEDIKNKPSGDRPNQIDQNGEIKTINANTIKAGEILGTTLKTGEQGARVIVGGAGDEANDIIMVDDSTGGTSPITGNTASLNFKRSDDATQIFKIQKRAGINDDDENVMEFFYDKAANGSQKNYIFLGNKGDNNTSQTLTDIIQAEVKKQISLLCSNAYDSSAGTAQANITAFNTDGVGSLNDGGVSVQIAAHKANTDSGYSDGGSISFNVFNNGSATAGNTWMIIDSNGIYLVSNNGTQTGLLGVNDSTGALQWNGVDIS